MEPLPASAAQAPDAPPRCRNCDHPAPQAFCPQCGQEQTDKITSVRHLLADLFSNILTIDARFLRTTMKLLFRPGFLTQSYVAGRRARFTPPARLYVVVSLLFFFSLSLSGGLLKDLLYDAPEPTDAGAAPTDTGAQADALEDLWAGFQDGRGDTTHVLTDSSGRRVEIGADGFRVQDGETEVEAGDGQWRINMGDEEITIGSPGDDSDTDWEKVRAKFIEQMPKMMFALLPIFALMLKVLYIRRSRYYIEHLIFALHFHAFSFLVMMVGVWLDFFLEMDTFYDISTLLMLFYFYKSLRNVYQQGWIKTIIKGSFLLTWYSITLGIAMILIIAIAAGDVGWFN